MSQVIDVLGLMGDAVDNIPGIKGIGEKTAAKLLAEYETLENILDNADKIKGSMGEKIRAGKESAILSKKLATIIIDVPVIFHEEDFCLKEWNRPALKEVFADLEFRTLTKRLLGEELPAATGGEEASAKPAPAPQAVQTDLFGNIVGGPEPVPAPSKSGEEVPGISELIEGGGRNIHNTPHHYEACSTPDELKQLVLKLSDHTEICFDTETTGIDANEAELVGLSFSIVPGEAFYVPCPADRDQTLEVLGHFLPLFGNPDITWIGQNIKYDLLMLKWYGVEIKGHFLIPCWRIM